MSYDMHVKFEGGQLSIKGSSKHQLHKQEVPILAWSWGTSNTGNLHTGDGFASGGKADIQDITITKYVDGSSNAFLGGCVKGARADSCTLSISNATGEQKDFVVLKLDKGVLVSSVSMGGTTGDERLTETITLHFGAFRYEFKGQDETGSTSGAKTAEYDMREVKGQFA